MSKLIKGTHHIALKPAGRENLQETIHFYCDLLGLETVRRWVDGTGIMLWTGNSILEINEGGGERLPQGSIRHFALATDDVDECVRIVREAGYSITVEPKDVSLPTDDAPYPIRVAFCIGPVGEEIEFFQEC